MADALSRKENSMEIHSLSCQTMCFVGSLWVEDVKQSYVSDEKCQELLNIPKDQQEWNKYYKNEA